VRSHASFSGCTLACLLVLDAARAAAQPSPTTEQCVQAAARGQSSRDEGRLLEARDAFAFCSQDGCPAAVRRDCIDWTASVAGRIPSVRLRALDAEGQDVVDGDLSLDGKPLVHDGRAIPIDPGPHTLTLRRGAERTEKKIVILESEKERILEIKLPPVAQAPPPQARPVAKPAVPVPAAVAHPDPLRRVAWALTGVGAAGLVFSGYMGALMLQRKSSAETGCVGSACTQEALDRFDEARAQGTISTVAFGVGLGSLVAGVYLLLRPRSPEPKATLSPSVGARAASLELKTSW
jgi:hypothetical protein